MLMCLCGRTKFFFGVTGEYRLMSQPRGHRSKSSNEEHTRIVQNGGMGLCEFKSSKRKWDLSWREIARDWFVPREVFLVHDLDRRGRLSRSIAAISAASDRGFAQKDVRFKSGKILVTSGGYP